ncbi:hypothetical protein DSO57_1014092 [Entomophthora muscae]|uniref:Uncharacterized protein n=1 Tax=Entomophthora muscae TaxID=34485 RepID=A0ACC2UFL9_9FUNG|nr:hypothetical protein DSO57_1014092 [Entomophthora muscae]
MFLLSTVKTLVAEVGSPSYIIPQNSACWSYLPPGRESNPRHQAGDGNLPTPGFSSKSKKPGAGTIPALAAAVGPVLGPKSYTQALVGLVGPGKANFSYPVLQVQAHPPLSLSSLSQNGDQIGKTSMTPAAKLVRTNDQPGQDGPPTSQTTVPEDPKNDHEAANQTAEPEIPSLAT